MSHNIFDTDYGFTTFTTWHRHPNYVLVEAITMDHLLDAFPWHIESQPVYIHGGSVFRLIEIPNKRAQVRVNNDGTVVPLSVMSNSYRALQPKDTYGPLYEICTEFGLEAASVGSVLGGVKTFMSFDLPAEMAFDFGGFRIDKQSVNFLDSYGGQSTCTGTNSGFATQCDNTWSANLVGRPRMFSIPHRSQAEKYRDEVLASLDAALANAAGMGEAVERLLNEAYSYSDFVNIVYPGLFGERPTDKGRAQTLWDKQTDALSTRYFHVSQAGYQGTKLAAIMAVQAYEQHDKTVRNQDRQVRHLDNLLFGKQPLATKTAAIVGV